MLTDLSSHMATVQRATLTAWVTMIAITAVTVVTMAAVLGTWIRMSDPPTIWIVVVSLVVLFGLNRLGHRVGVID